MCVGNSDIKHYESLANAIIVQAVLDYRAVYRVLQKNPHDRTCQAQAKQLKNFFHSRWFRTLTSVDAEYLIRQVEKEIENEVQKPRAYRSKGYLFHGN